MKQVVMVDPDLSDLCEDFVALRAREMASIKESFEKRDLQAVRELAHRIKGASGMMQAHFLEEDAARLEQAALTANQDDVWTAILILEASLGKLEFRTNH